MPISVVKSKKRFLACMKLTVWNTRGCGNGRFLIHVSDLVRIHLPDVLLLETKVTGTVAVITCDAIDMTNMHQIDDNSNKGRI